MTRIESLLVSLLIASLQGCAAFRGYRNEPSREPRPAALEAVAGPLASVDLSGVGDSGGTGGFSSRKRVLLGEVVGVARERANIVLEAAARMEAASGRVQSADGALLPVVGIEAGAGYLEGREIGSFGELGDDLSFARFEPAVSVRYRVNPGAAIAQSKRWRGEADAAAYDAREA